MARVTKSPRFKEPFLPIPPTVSPEQGIKLLRRQHEKGVKLLAKNRLTFLDEDYNRWEYVTYNYLIKAFGSHSPNVKEVIDVEVYGNDPAKVISKQLQIIDSLIEVLEAEVELQPGPSQDAISAPSGNRVFLVHGHDEVALYTTARFLEKLDLAVIILREQPNEGRTIIDKFVGYSDVGFAIVLLIPDDRGGPASAPYEEQAPRARQNVIFELGYFLGKLGRKRVCALYREGVEIPSDYSGVLFLPFDDAGAWRFTLVREMKAAGLDVDMNKAI